MPECCAAATSRWRGSKRCEATSLYADAEEQKFWQGVRQSPTRTAREVRAQFRDLDCRLAELEAYYVSSNPRLSAEIENLRG